MTSGIWIKELGIILKITVQIFNDLSKVTQLVLAAPTLEFNSTDS